jgi:hypothetical protein
VVRSLRIHTQVIRNFYLEGQVLVSTPRFRVVPADETVFSRRAKEAMAISGRLRRTLR